MLAGQAGTITKLDGSRVQVCFHSGKNKVWRTVNDVVPLFSAPRKTKAEVGDFVKLASPPETVGQVIAIKGGKWQIEIASTGNKVWRQFSDITELPAAVLLKGAAQPATGAPAAKTAAASSVPALPASVLGSSAAERQATEQPGGDSADASTLAPTPKASLANKRRDIAEEEGIKARAEQIEQQRVQGEMMDRMRDVASCLCGRVRNCLAGLKHK